MQSGFHLLEEEDGADLGLCQMEDQAAPPTLKQLDCLKAILRKQPTNLMTPIISKATNLLCSLSPPVRLPPPPPPLSQHVEVFPGEQLSVVSQFNSSDVPLS